MGVILGCSHLDVRNFVKNPLMLDVHTYNITSEEEHRRTRDLSELVECLLARLLRLHLAPSKRLIVYMEMSKQKEKVEESTSAKYSSLYEISVKSCFLLVRRLVSPCPHFQPAVLPRRHLRF